MKKAISIILSLIIAASVFTALPLNIMAAKKKVSLNKYSTTLKISKKNGKTVYGTMTVKFAKIKGVSIKAKSFKSSNAKIAKVTKKGKITAKKKGKANITVKVKFKYKKKTYKKSMTLKVTVKDTRSSGTVVGPERPASSEDELDKDAEIENATPLNKVNTPTGNADTFTDAQFLKKLSAFSNKLYVMSAKDQNENYTMSPASVYFALAMLHSIGDSTVKSEIEGLTEMNSADIAETGELFKALTKKYQGFGNTVCRLDLTNSIWLDKGKEADKDTLDMLADQYYCAAYETPFKDDNDAANKAIREFVKHQTNGLIDQDFQIPADTLFALINTLYFKDVWDEEIDELRTEKRDFNLSDGKVNTEFLIGKYVDGQIQETDCSYYFYARTAHGYKAKFILPKDGYTLKQAMSAENLNTVNQDNEFNATVDKTKHFTRCIFPSFKIESSTPLKEVLAQNELLPHTFSCYTSPLLAEPLQVSDIKHKVVIDVSKTGIEGAAVTMIISKAGAVFDETEKVYHDFILDKNFGFIITDKNDVVLFEGQVTNPKQ